MSLSTVVIYPQVMQQLSPKNSEKAHDSPVIVIHGNGLKQVKTSSGLKQQVRS
jgi:hypothetical protein